jgi:nitrate reductase delta subunit
MLTLKVLAALLVYPERALIESLDEMAAVLEAERALPSKERRAIEALIADLRAADLLDAQARYVALFDHSRSLSLHLYEHSHGESRDRGQAMVNLLNHYRAHGLDPGTSELPDFLPLFLEFLSTRPAGEARALLGQAVWVVALLRARLEQRGAAPYAAVFRALEALAPHRADEAAIRETVGGEARDDTPEALDRAWEEAPVTFRDDPAAAGAGCSTASAMVARFAPPPGTGATAHRSGPR